MSVRYLLAWVLMVPIAVINGAVRVRTYGQFVSELGAHQISTLTAVVLFGIYIFGVTRLWPTESSKQAILIGAIWLAMTVAFEFLFGHFVAGHSWQRLCHDYNLAEGRVWVFVPIWIAIAPYLFHRTRRS